jgi:glutamate synthase (ferredoxin)
MHFIAEELREMMAMLGFRTLNEMIGRCDRLEMKNAVDHWKAKRLDFSALLCQPDVPSHIGRYCQISQDHGLEKSLDQQVLLDLCEPALERKEHVRASLPIRNTNRVAGTILGSELTRRWGAEGLPEDTIHLHFKGSAGQSFGAFVPRGITLELEGDSNDYIGKGLDGGRIIVYPSKKATFRSEENIVIGNVAFYGAIKGEAYIRGMAGERFCVRNSGVHAVVEAVGDHGCEYMTGGRVVVLGDTGRNFAAGMSGGLAYVLDLRGDFPRRCNRQMVKLEPLKRSDDIEELRGMIERFLNYTGRNRAKWVLDLWPDMVRRFFKVIPNDYRRVLIAMAKVQSGGLSGDEAVMAAFRENVRDLSRIGGN